MRRVAFALALGMGCASTATPAAREPASSCSVHLVDGRRNGAERPLWTPVVGLLRARGYDVDVDHKVESLRTVEPRVAELQIFEGYQCKVRLDLKKMGLDSHGQVMASSLTWEAKAAATGDEPGRTRKACQRALAKLVARVDRDLPGCASNPLPAGGL